MAKGTVQLRVDKSITGNVNEAKGIPKSIILTDKGMERVIPVFIGKEVEVTSVPIGIELEQDDLEEIRKALRTITKSYAETKKVVNIMKQKMQSMDNYIAEREELKLEEAQDFFGYFFWIAPYFSNNVPQHFKNVLSEKLDSDEETKQKYWMRLMVPDADLYSIEIAKDWQNMSIEELRKKHPFLTKLGSTDQIEKPLNFVVKTKRNDKHEALSELEEKLSKRDYQQIKQYSDLIAEIQMILEIKNYYWPQMMNLLHKKGLI
ncbi:MAG: hypothetical protein J4432_02085 [DPANN group archaeon]|nr:hypothetical protein [DPANN group archaeon]